MTEHNEAVERQRQLLAAEDWAKETSGIHVHPFNSMWYDNRPQDTANGEMVTDVSYNSGIVKRYKKDKLIHVFGEELTGQALLDQYTRST